MRGSSSVILRRLLVRRQVLNPNSTNIAKSLISHSTNNTTVPKIPSFRNYIPASSSQSQSQMLPSLQFHRTLFSSPDGPSNILVIESGEEFNSSLGKVKDDSLPAIFYFTAAWCGPCKFIWPVIGELSAKHPHVTTYKIDIDQKPKPRAAISKGLESTLSKLNISAVPTFLFFQHGEKVAEIVGADVSRLKTTMEQLYKLKKDWGCWAPCWPYNKH
ncbi:Thioredoxin O1 [Citrus sinensis]|uniref:Thioredoxin O1 n=2 Tax=Citrus sinensis TaxID=2711 RepID=A0ACB8NCC9_CITSI|nr:Thioredoxin O1 [Citrus sinensis]